MENKPREIDANKVIEKLLQQNQRLTMQVAMLEIQIEELQEKPKPKE